MADMITPAGATRKRVKKILSQRGKALSQRGEAHRATVASMSMRAAPSGVSTHACRRHATRLNGGLCLHSFYVAFGVKSNVKQHVEPACIVTARQAPINPHNSIFFGHF